MSNVTLKALEITLVSATRTRADLVKVLEVSAVTLADAKARLAVAVADLNGYEIDNDDHEIAFCESIDDSHDGLFGIPASQIMRRMDPCMYNQELNDYVDGLDKEDQQGYKDLEEIKEEIEDEIADIEQEIEDAQDEIEEIDQEMKETQDQINSLR